MLFRAMDDRTEPGFPYDSTGQYRPGSVGVTVPNSECRIVDPETGEDKAVGEEGELWIALW